MFSDRIEKRNQLWWHETGSRPSFIEYLRRLEMVLVNVPDDAPLSRWKRGEFWQRRLLNKRNGKVFAARLNCRVPELYWHGRFLTRSIVSSLPEQFVFKPVTGAGQSGIHVMCGSRELIRDRTLTRSQLFDQIVSERGRLSHLPMLAEEYIPGEEGRGTLPLDYKFYMFADRVGAIEVVNRTSGLGEKNTHHFYTPEWQPIDDPMQTYLDPDVARDPPACLPLLLSVARTLGGEIGTFMRIDLYAKGGDCYLGEFSSVPYQGKTFTPYANQLFETFWQEACPAEI